MVFLNKLWKLLYMKYGNFINDVALLKLDSSLVFSKNIKAISLETLDASVGSRVIISSWGRLKTVGDSPIKLQWNTLETISKLKCFTSILMSSDALICLAHTEGNGACNGDSGGLAYTQWWACWCFWIRRRIRTKNPDGYAKVSYHIDWIKQHSDVLRLRCQLLKT